MKQSMNIFEDDTPKQIHKKKKEVEGLDYKFKNDDDEKEDQIVFESEIVEEISESEIEKK